MSINASAQIQGYTKEYLSASAWDRVETWGLKRICAVAFLTLLGIIPAICYVAYQKSKCSESMQALKSKISSIPILDRETKKVYAATLSTLQSRGRNTDGLLDPDRKQQRDLYFAVVAKLSISSESIWSDRELEECSQLYCIFLNLYDLIEGSDPSSMLRHYTSSFVAMFQFDKHQMRRDIESAISSNGEMRIAGLMLDWAHRIDQAEAAARNQGEPAARLGWLARTGARISELANSALSLFSHRYQTSDPAPNQTFDFQPQIFDYTEMVAEDNETIRERARIRNTSSGTFLKEIIANQDADFRAKVAESDPEIFAPNGLPARVVERLISSHSPLTRENTPSFAHRKLNELERLRLDPADRNLKDTLATYFGSDVDFIAAVQNAQELLGRSYIAQMLDSVVSLVSCFEG